jgi:hypothetical protein
MNSKEAATDLVESPCFPGNGPKVDLSALTKPCFIVTVDTEEEFDWNVGFTRDRHGLKHLHKVAPFQALCEGQGVKPAYLVDFPVANDGFGAELFGDWARRGVAEIGLQLHPWVNPPFDEEVSTHNSYACNLPRTRTRKAVHLVRDCRKTDWSFSNQLSRWSIWRGRAYAFFPH